jgi:thiol-disulfide isomerase/thioredoxin
MLRVALLIGVLAFAGLGSFALRRYVARAPIPSRFDRSDVDVYTSGTMLVEFTSPYCHECQVAYPVLQAASEAYDAPLALIDAKQRPDLTGKYSIRTTPTILVVDRRGRVTTGWFATPSEDELTSALILAGAPADRSLRYSTTV